MTKNTFSDFIPPMMAQSVKTPFDPPDWIFEIKLDGYRVQWRFCDLGKPYLMSRNPARLRNKFAVTAKAVFKLKLRAIGKIPI